MKITKLTVSFMAICLIFLFSGTVYAGYLDKKISTGNVRIFYPKNMESTCDAILLGVGTAMSTDSYDKLSNSLTDYGYTVVIMDHNPKNMVKTDAAKFKALATDVKKNLVDWLSFTKCNAIGKWIMGGHSAGGQAAQDTLSSTPDLADAIFSFDPFDCSKSGTVDIPALYWGFGFTSCFVKKNDAAKAAYLKSNGRRVFYQVKEDYKLTPCGYAPAFFHCSVGDKHCLACTNCVYTPDYFFEEVANSVHKFIEANFYGTWTKSNLAIDNPKTPISLFVDNEQPK